MISRAVIALLLLGYLMPVAAVEEAGQVLFVAGSVTAERTESVVLKKADPVFEKDIIVTAARSRGQLLMRDGAKFALRPETRFVVEEYFLAGDERVQPDGSVVVTADDSAVTELIKGGFRTITGAIGKDDPDAYEVKTAAATMGIRGTHYSVAWCAGDCKLPPGVSKAKSIPDGLYIGVTDGIVQIRNLTGEYLQGAGEYVFVRDRNSVPVRLSEMPPALIDTFATEDDVSTTEQAAQEIRDTIAALGASASSVGFGSTGPGATPAAGDFSARSDAPAPRPATVQPDDESGEPGNEPGAASFDQTTPYDSSVSGFEAEPETPILTDQGLPLTGGVLPGSRPVAVGSGPIGGLSMTVFTGSSNLGSRTFAGNDLIQFQSPPSTGDTSYAIGTAGIRDDGFDPVTGIGWGRWTAEAATITQADGSVISADLSLQSLHWVYGPDTATAPALPVTGTANFSLIAGNTDPTDTLGNSGVLGNATLLANFTTATVQSELSLAIGGSNWSASGSGMITNALFSGLYNMLTIDGRAGGTGNFSGFFGAPAAAGGLPNGAGLTYGLTDLQGVSVSGAVVFGPPTP